MELPQVWLVDGVDVSFPWYKVDQLWVLLQVCWKTAWLLQVSWACQFFSLIQRPFIICGTYLPIYLFLWVFIHTYIYVYYIYIHRCIHVLYIYIYSPIYFTIENRFIYIYIYIDIWIMVSKENHPQITLFQVSELLSFTRIFPTGIAADIAADSTWVSGGSPGWVGSWGRAWAKDGMAKTCFSKIKVGHEKKHVSIIVTTLQVLIYKR